MPGAIRVRCLRQRDPGWGNCISSSRVETSENVDVENAGRSKVRPARGAGLRRWALASFGASRLQGLTAPATSSRSRPIDPVEWGDAPRR